MPETSWFVHVLKHLTEIDQIPRWNDLEERLEGISVAEKCVQ